MKKKLFIILLICACSSSLYAQVIDEELIGEGETLRKNILDDSTRLVYDYSTLLYVNESNLKYNFKDINRIDTTLHNLENWSTMNKNDNKIQDLGNEGTATKWIYYHMPREIGRTSGYNAYDIYYSYPNSIRYFNTKSPFTDIQLILGNKSRSTLDVDFSRNINPGWNAGFDFSTQDIDKLLNSQGKNDTHIKTTEFDIYSWFRSKNSKYNLLTYFNRFEHNVYEQGGIIITPNESPFKYNEAPTYLNNAKVKDFRFSVHAYQEYKWRKALTFFHEFDLTKQEVTYFAVEDQLSRFKFPVFINQDTTSQKSKYAQVENELGIKGIWKRWLYMLYAKHRNVNFSQKYIPEKETDNEFYVGAYMRLDLDSLSKSTVSISAQLGLDGRHRLRGEFVSDYADLSYERAQFAPTYLASNYFGNHLQWHNNFSDQQSDQIKAKLKYKKSDWLEFNPKMSLTNLANYIYYDIDRMPKQTSAFGQIWTFGTDFNVTFLKNVHFDNEFIYSLTSGGSAELFRLPDMFFNSKLYFAGAVYQDKLFIETGFNLHYTSKYYADDYDPTTQQFYLQDKSLSYPIGQRVGGYVIADAYLSFRISTFRAFFKYVNLFQKTNEGYFVSPFYTGPPSGLDFGIKWTFFD